MAGSGGGAAAHAAGGAARKRKEISSDSSSDLGLSDSDDDRTVGEKGEEGAPASRQEEKAKADLARRKQKQNAEFKSKLDTIKANPELWHLEENKYLREFVNYVETHRRAFRCAVGDDILDTIVSVPREERELTSGYIRAIAEHRSTDFVDYPVLFVIGRTTRFEQQRDAAEFSNVPAPPIKRTILRVVDGDGNQMTAMLATQLADQARQITRGDIIRLDLYTETTHRVNSNSPRMPAVFILKYSLLDYAAFTPVDALHEPIACTSTLPFNALPASASNPDRSAAPVDCNATNRYCSIHDVTFPACICDSVRVEDVDLEAITEDCWFATETLEEMSNSHKRNVIYWWYATNHYNICGKRKRKPLPKCLVHKIRQLYPSDEFTGYETTHNMHQRS